MYYNNNPNSKEGEMVCFITDVCLTPMVNKLQIVIDILNYPDRCRGEDDLPLCGEWGDLDRLRCFPELESMQVSE